MSGMARRWADVAELIATQGLKGRLAARSVHGLPFLLSEGSVVHFVPPTFDGPRTARVLGVQHAGSDTYLVEFSGVKDRETSERLVGSHCLVARADLPEDFERLAQDPSAYLTGVSVHDAVLGDIGRIVEVRPMPTQDLLVVQGPYGEVLVPLVDEFTVDFDAAERVLFMSLPQGLVGLDSPDDAEGDA